MDFKMALFERALAAELGCHRSYPMGAAKPEVATNQRNGCSAKTVLSEGRSAAPGDSPGSGRQLQSDPDPQYSGRFTGFDDKIVAVAGGMTMREMQGEIRIVRRL